MWRYLLACTTSCLAGCVQPAYDRTVVYELDASGVSDVVGVGVRGSNTPLSWETDFALEPVVEDSLYRATVTYRTGYLVTEVKFTINGAFEFEGEPNRRVVFSGDTTLYRARFNNRP